MDLDYLDSKLKSFRLWRSNYEIVPTRLKDNSLKLLLVRNNKTQVMGYVINTTLRESQFKLHTNPTFNEMMFFIKVLDQLTFKEVPETGSFLSDLDKYQGFVSEKIYYPTQLAMYLKSVLVYLNSTMLSDFESVFNTYGKAKGLVPKTWVLKRLNGSTFVIVNSQGSPVLEVNLESGYHTQGVSLKLRVQSTGKSLNSLRKTLKSFPKQNLANCNLYSNPASKYVFLDMELLGDSPLFIPLSHLLSAIYEHAVTEQTTKPVNLNF